MATATTPTPAPVTLALRGSSYTFAPQRARGVVAVTFVGPWTTYRKEVPVGEARAKWAALVKSGYERF